ncbi:hypothetical protein AB1Y20_016332 [Prymnesium parvum]
MLQKQHELQMTSVQSRIAAARAASPDSQVETPAEKENLSATVFTLQRELQHAKDELSRLHARQTNDSRAPKNQHQQYEARRLRDETSRLQQEIAALKVKLAEQEEIQTEDKRTIVSLREEVSLLRNSEAANHAQSSSKQSRGKHREAAPRARKAKLGQEQVSSVSSQDALHEEAPIFQHREDDVQGAGSSTASHDRLGEEEAIVLSKGGVASLSTSRNVFAPTAYLRKGGTRRNSQPRCPSGGSTSLPSIHLDNHVDIDTALGDTNKREPKLDTYSKSGRCLPTGIATNSISMKVINVGTQSSVSL